MKISLDWLRQYIDFDHTPAELASRLTAQGIEVEAVEDFASRFDKIVVGEILEAKPHPNADKLQVTKVTIGSGEPLTIVCGAPNARAGIKVAVATIGADLGEGFIIKKSKIRGEASEGMLCSESELGLSDSHDGILELPAEAIIGTPLAKALGKNDVVFEIGLTPNRADCLSHIGVAREVGLSGGKNLRRGVVDLSFLEKSKEKAKDAVKVRIENPDLCPRYAARIIRGVKVKESPQWLKERLGAVGLRPRNNIVDITNFVLMECGHPLHAFDLKKVKDSHIIVRTAEGFATKFTTLDGKERTLPPTALLIADSEKPLAIAGVMGGGNSEITDATTDVLIESAYFNPSSIRKTAKSLGLSTDASYRFERGTDLEIVTYAVDRAAALMAELGGGEVLDGIVDEYPNKIELKTFSFRPSRARMLLGMNITNEKMETIFADLRITVTKESEDSWVLTSPSWRVDLEREVDAVEEIVRIIGYDNIPISPGERTPYNKERDALPIRVFNEIIRGELIAIGFSECVSVPMLPADIAKKYHSSPVEVMNPLTVELQRMRTSIIPNLLDIARRNERFGAKGQRLFEIGNVFSYSGKPQVVGNVVERGELCILLKDELEAKNVYNTRELKADIYSLRSAVEQIIRRAGVRGVNVSQVKADADSVGVWQNIAGYIDRNEALVFSIGRNVIALAGVIAPNVTKEYDLRSAAYIAVIDFDQLHSLARKEREKPQAVKALARYPSVERDVALVLGKDVMASQLIEEVRSALPKELTEDVHLFDEFQSKEMKQSGERSLGVRMILRSESKTLEDEEVERIVAAVVTSLEKKLSVKLRT